MKVSYKEKDGKRIPDRVVKVVFGQHCHVLVDNGREANKALISAEMKEIEQGSEGALALKEKHEQWQEEARRESQPLKKKLLDRMAVVQYGCNRLHLSGRQIAENTDSEMRPRTINMARLRQLQKKNEITTVAELINSGKHHLLKARDEDILVFGRPSAIVALSTTNFILSDGTFTCILPGYSQLYVFHTMVENNVCLPMLYCLVKGKDNDLYVELLKLVEELAQEHGTTFFKRPVTLMCDFEKAYIKAVRDIYTGGQVLRETIRSVPTRKCEPGRSSS